MEIEGVVHGGVIVPDDASALTEGRRVRISPILQDRHGTSGRHDPDLTTAVSPELDRLARLEHNWDSYGAPPIDPNIIAAARTFIAALPATCASRPRVVPMSPGNLQFEWRHEGKLLELEFEDPQTIHFLQWHPQAGVEEEASFPASDIGRAVDLIQYSMSRTAA